ncbi:MAG: hypothetical protein MJZ12_06565 [Prevotella sp.]|nr:hypothetical protein [Prevotella sp.]
MKKIVLTMLLMFAGIGLGWCGIALDDQNTQKTQNTTDNKKREKERKANVKKQLDQARQNIKKGNNLENTEKQMRELLKDSLNSGDLSIRIALYNSIRKQYEQGNEKLFLKQKYDTASLFNIAQRMFIELNNLDSIDALPDSEGKVKLRYRKSHASMLKPYHHNLYGGGVFYLNHQKYKEAVSCLDTYLSAFDWPLFSTDRLPADSTTIHHAGYVSLLAGYLQGDVKSALKYENLALKFQPRLENILQYLAELHLQNGDTLKYEQYLCQGVDRYPRSQFFFPHLIDFYCNNGLADKAMKVTDNVLKKDSLNVLFLRARQMIFLNKGKYDDCIAIGDKILAIDDSLADVNYNVGLAYYNKAIEMNRQTGIKAREKAKRVNELYAKCRPYMEHYRALMPEEKERWRPILYAVYLNLNLGKEFDEIQKLK